MAAKKSSITKKEKKEPVEEPKESKEKPEKQEKSPPESKKKSKTTRGSVKRVKSGIFGLDEFISGGIPNKSITLILGEPGTGKSTFCLHFIHQGLANKESCIFISTSETNESLVQMMNAIGLGENAEKIIFIDCYSWRLGTASKSKYSISQPSDLNQLSLAIDRAIGEGKAPYRIVFDSLSDIILHVKPEIAMKFIQVISAKIRKVEGEGLFTLEKGMHEEKHVKTIEYLVDGIVDMSIKRDNRFIKIRKMAKTLHTLKPIHFKISTEKGIGVEVSEFFK